MSNSQSQGFINVRGEQSSSPERLSVVEDSLKDHPEVYQGGAVQTPQALVLDDDEDELYSESPEAKNRRLAKEALALGRGVSPMRDASVATREDEPSNIDPKKLQRTDGQSIEESSHARPQKPQPIEQKAPNANGKLDVTQAAGTKSNAAPASSSTHGSRHQQHHESKSSASQAATMSRPTGKPRQSALEALRARRNGDADVVAASAQPSSETAKSNAADRQDARPEVAELANAMKSKAPRATPVPPPVLPSVQQSGPNLKRPTTGKLQPSKGRLSGSTSRTAETNQYHPNDDDSDSSDELTKDYGRPQSSSHPPSAKGALKTPKLKNVSSASRLTSQYDLEVSPESTQSAHPSRDTVKAPTTGQRGTAARSTRRGRAARTNEPTRNTARRQRAEREQSEQPKTSRRGRMKAESNAPPTIQPEPSVSAKGKAKATPVGLRSPETKTARNKKVSKNRSEAQDRSESSAIYDVDDDDSANAEDVYYDAAEQVAPVGAVSGKKTGHATPKAAGKQPAQASPGQRSRNGRTSAARQSQASPSAANRLQPGTPRVPHSSPPTTTAATHVNEASKKPKIIAFGRSGPQNQGASSARKEVASATKVDRFSFPPQPSLQPEKDHGHNLRDRTKTRSSIPPPDQNRRERNDASKRTNVAADVSNALASFKKITRSPTRANTRDNEAAVQPTVDDNDFMDIDDFNSTTMIAEEDEPANKSSRRVATTRTLSQQQMPPPRAEPEKKGKILPPTEAHEQGPGSVTSQNPIISQNPPLKRSHGGKDAPQLPEKRLRASTQDQSEVVEVPKAPMQPTRRFADQRNPASALGITKSAPEPVKRASQKPARERSHGSQKVDMQGSPIPTGMVLQENGTVLESYSQQADRSPDEQLAVPAIPVDKPSNKRTKMDPKAHPEPPSPRATERISNNRKRGPSGPEEESQVITKVQRKDYREPLVGDETSTPSPDPFAGNDRNQKVSTARRTSSALFDELRQLIQYETVDGLRQHASAPNIPDEAVASLRRSPLKQTTHRAKGGAFSDSRKHHDPDKTLVNSESGLRLSVSKRAASVSTVSSSSSVPSAESSPKHTSDLAMWRNALEPHQMKLFDGLVIVSHKLVRHLVDRETAEKDIADDYRRRATAIVEQFEQRQAKEYQDAMKRIKTTKKRFHRELVKCRDQLEEQIANVKEMRAERKEEFANRETLEMTLQNLMAQVC